MLALAKGGMDGTTSACAENTRGRAWGPRYPRNYLRVRGEYLRVPGMPMGVLELPPRARRIHPTSGDRRFLDGTTSACAENTLTLANIKVSARNYLRVRGEYCTRPC